MTKLIGLFVCLAVLMLKTVTFHFFFFFQCLVALGVVGFGVINVAGDLKEIRVTAELEKQSFETVWNNPSFYSFNHRGKALFGE